MFSKRGLVVGPCGDENAIAVEKIHLSGHVIGDVNERGFFVCVQGMVRMVDCDSFQIKNNGRQYRCSVGVPLFTPPELQHVNFADTDRTSDHDCFGLAILLFQLLFGRHPFAGRYSGSGDMPSERAIVERRFAFSRNANSFAMSPPPHCLTLDSMPRQVAEMFERAFVGGSPRPSAGEWRSTMKSLKDSLIQCGSGRLRIDFREGFETARGVRSSGMVGCPHLLRKV